MIKHSYMNTVSVVCGLLMTAGAVLANNLQVTNVMVSARDGSTAYVTFDIRWENSWRNTNINHDAAWVFFKVQPQGSAEWQHVTLEGSGVNPSSYSNGVGTAIDLIVPDDRVGLFVRRAAEGSGTVSVTNVQAVWNFASNSLVKSSKVRMQALAVEMVHVAEGTNTVGSGGTESGSFTAGPWSSGATTPFAIASESALEIGNAAGKLWGTSSGGNNTIGGAGTLAAAFPKGYAAFYCMKYEITEGQWVDFFNMLTDAQKMTRDITGGTGKISDLVVNRNTVAWTNTTVAATSATKDRACSYLSWADGCAFMDWSGLRPMTELEFEKACRGPLTPVAGEYAWGSTTISATTAIANDGTGTDTATGGNCNYLTSVPDGPYRVGIYATTTSTREQAGACYWGIMELSDNLWERPVSVGHATVGRLFTGVHNDGRLNVSGDADVSAWPGADAAGTGLRGGGWGDGNTLSCVSYRGVAVTVNATRNAGFGGRGVRTVPAGVRP